MSIDNNSKIEYIFPVNTGKGGQQMPDYQKLYALLFNAVTDAVEALERQNYGTARDTLIAAQQHAEEMYIETDGAETRQ